MTLLCAGMGALPCLAVQRRGFDLPENRVPCIPASQFSGVPDSQNSSEPGYLDSSNPVTQRPSFLDFQLSSDPDFWGSVTAPGISRRSQR